MNGCNAIQTAFVRAMVGAWLAATSHSSHAADDAKPALVFNEHRRPVELMAFARDGKSIASCSFDTDYSSVESSGGAREDAVEVHGYGLVKSWDVSNGKVRHTVDFNQLMRKEVVRAIKRKLDLTEIDIEMGRVRTIELAPDGKMMSVGDSSARVKLWDFKSQKFVWETNMYDDVMPLNTVDLVTYSPDGRTIAALCDDGRVRLLDAATGKITGILETDRQIQVVYQVVFSNDGKLLALCEANAIIVFDVETRRFLCSRGDGGFGMEGMAFSADSKSVIAYHSNAEVIWTFDIATDKLTRETKGIARTPADDETGHRTLAAFSRSTSVLALNNKEGKVALWDVGSGKLRSTLATGHKSVWQIAFSPDDKMMATCGDDGTVKVWSMESPMPGK